MDGWSDRAPPRRIFGNTYYVGTCGIAAILVVGDAGAILIDGATEQAPAAILANIRALGFDPHQVKLLLNTHEHMDHAGGLAGLQRETGALLLARAPAVAALRSGAADRDDPQFADLTGFPAIADVRTLADDEVVRLGSLALASHATPGHAPGGTSWTWRSCEGARCLDIAYVDSLSALTDGHYRFADHPDYVAAFERSFDTVAGLPCDLLLTPHPAASDLLARLNGDAPLVDPGACKAFAANARANLATRLADERTDPPR
jgi:metallo-beta-lactamase class B